MVQGEVQYLEVGGRSIAYRLRPGKAPTIVFLPGYMSDMEGTKALALDAFAAQRGTAMFRLDYSGTGSSKGAFEDGTLAMWLDEALALLDRLTEGPLVVVGSSMGAWIGLRLSLLRPARVRSLLCISGAPDFTEWGFREELKARLRAGETLRGHGHYGERITTAAFWSSGQELRLLDGEIGIDCPVRLVHGDLDADVPLEVAFRTLRALRSADVQLTVIKGGGHRLSEPHEIDAILRAVAALLEPGA